MWSRCAPTRSESRRQARAIRPRKGKLDGHKSQGAFCHITAEFSGSFTPPPKSINDILSAIKNVNLTPQRCENVVTFSEEEVRESMRSYPPGTLNRVRFALHQAEREFHRGNFLRSVKYQQWGIDAMPSNWRAGRARNYATLATYFVYAGDFAAADDALSQALGSAAGIKRSRYTGQAKGWDWFRFEFNLGRAAIAESKGDLIRGEATYLQAFDEADQADLYGEPLGFAKLALARNLTRQGRLLEAENTVREVLRYRLGSQQTTTTIVATALMRLSENLYEQGRYGEAEALARATVTLYRILCVAPENLFLTTTQNVLGKSLVAQERWPEALAQYAAMRADMADDPGSFERMFAGNLYRALALLHGGKTAEAVEHLQAALERSRERLGDKHYNTAEIRGFFAMARLAEGDREAALDEFSAATRILLKRSREADDESTTFAARDRRLNLILGSYIGLLADIRGTALARDAGIDAVSEAFRLAEIARSRSVQRALSASGARAALTDPTLADLARREQDTQKQVAALYGTLAQALARPFGKQDRELIDGLRITIDQLRGARAALMEEIEGRFPDYANLVNPQPPTLEAVRTTLRPGEALISTYTSEDRSYVWALPKSGPVVFAAVPLGRDGLARRVDLLRRALDPNARTLNDIPDFDIGAAHDLYKELLEPVEDGWRRANTLLVVAHGPLGALPLAVLPTAPSTLAPEAEPLFSRYKDVPWLARSHAVATLPSVGSLVAQRALPAGNPRRRAFAGFADPWFSEAQASEAATAKRQVAKALTGRGLLATRGLPVTLRSLPQMQYRWQPGGRGVRHRKAESDLS